MDLAPVNEAPETRLRGPRVITPLTGVRAFAALWVVFHHLSLGPAYGLALPASLERFCALGYLGVDLFGFLSGFVITHNYAARLAQHDPATVGRYLWLRAVRIMPLHWLALAVLVVARFSLDGFDAEVPAQLYDTGALVQQALLVHGWGFGHFAWNIPSWTVSSEWLCYLLFPLVARWLATEPLGSRAASLAAVTLVATIGTLVRLGYADFNAAMGWGVLRIGGEFMTGCWLQRAWAMGFAREAPWWWIGPATLLAAIGLASIALVPGIVVCFAVLVYALAHERGALSRWLSGRIVVFLGEASYAIYLVHWVVLRLSNHWLPVAGLSDGQQAAAAVLDLGLVLGGAALVHVTFEKPVRARLRGWVQPV